MNIKHINWVISEHVLSYDQAEECDLNLFFGSFCCLFVCCFLWRSISNQVACCSAKQYLVAFSFLSCSYLGRQISQFSFYKEVCGLISPSWEKLRTTVVFFFFASCFESSICDAQWSDRNFFFSVTKPFFEADYENRCYFNLDQLSLPLELKVELWFFWSPCRLFSQFD